MIQLNRGEGAGFIGLILLGLILSCVFKVLPGWLISQTYDIGGGIFYKMGFSTQTLISMAQFFETFYAHNWKSAMELGFVSALVITLLFAIWTRIRSFRESIRS